jgi:predicted XRE-type DNA-binding protein
MNLTLIGNNNSDDFVIIDNHAQISQTKVAEITKVNQSTVSRWLCTNNNHKLKTQDFSIKDLIDFIVYIVLESKRTSSKTKRHCMMLLITFIDIEATQKLFTECLTKSFSSISNQPREDLMTSSVDNGSFVYLIQNVNTGNLKIGYSVNPCQRFNSLQQSTDCELKLLAFFEGTVNHEQILLSKYAEYQIRGEWFKPCPEIYLDFGLTTEFIKEISK